SAACAAGVRTASDMAPRLRVSARAILLTRVIRLPIDGATAGDTQTDDRRQLFNTRVPPHVSKCDRTCRCAERPDLAIRPFRRLLHELLVPDETDALHAVALCEREHLGDGVVVGATVRAHVQFGLRVLGRFDPEVPFEGTQLHSRAVPDDRAVKVDVETDR